MNSEVRIIQETVRIQEDSEISIDEIADFIDSEIRDKAGSVFKVDSVAIDYGDGYFKTPYFRSGNEFRNYNAKLEKFFRGVT